jgi:hypothetical protein
MRWTAATPVLAALLAACSGSPAEPAESRIMLAIHGDSIVYTTPDANRSADIATAAVDASTRLPVSGVSVDWQVSGGTATLASARSTTDEYGVATNWLQRAEPGTYRIRVSSPRLAGAAPNLQVRVVQRPAITALEPATVAAGAQVTIAGSNFSAEADQNTVLFNGVRGRVLSATPGQLRVEVPRCLPSRQVSVTASLGAVSSAPHLTTASATAGTSLDLVPGGVATLTAPADLECIRVPGVQNAAYLLVVHNTASLLAPPLPFELRALTPQAPLAAALPTAAPPAESFQDAWEAQLRRRERQYAGGMERPDRLLSVAAVPAAGSRREFNVLDQNSTFRKVTATARLVTASAVLYVDDSAANEMTDADLQYYGGLLDDPIRPAVTSVFGEPSDIDGNQRIIVLFTPVVNELTPRGRSSFVTGFFYGCDLVSRTRCSGTNQAEIVYSMVPDPSGRWGDARSAQLVRAVVPPVIAHELQHMLHFARRNSTSDALWLNEALAHTAEELVADVLQARGSSGLAQLFRSGNHERALRFLNAPGATSLLAEEPPGTVEMRGAAWLFLKYLRGHHGGNDLLLRLTTSQRYGAANIAHEAGRPWPDLTADFGVALWADGAPALTGPVLPRYTFVDFDLRTFISGSNSYPLRTTTLAWGDFAVSGAAGTGGHAYFTVANSTAAPPPLNVVLSSIRGAPFSTASAAAVSIVRVR